MVGRKLFRFLQLGVFLVLAACTTPPRAPIEADRELLYQAYTLAALSTGDFDGGINMLNLLSHGDFGLGTFNGLDGEMVVLDGIAYQVRDDGVATIAEAATYTPFAAVTFFDTDESLVISGTADCPTIQAQIDSQLLTLDAPYAIKVSGEFTSLKVRAPHKQSEPYPTLTDALADQVLFESQNISGTMVGFRLPEYIAGVNSAGYHFHFIADDKQHGGHVLECQAERLTVQIDTIERVEIDVTPSHTEPLPKAAIKYGVLLPYSGQYQWLGDSSHFAVIMVETTVNNEGGINGAPIQFVQADTEDSNEAGAVAAQAVIDEGVVALIGPTSLSLAGTMPLITENQIPMISPTAGTVELDRAGSDYFYRTVPSDSLGGRALAHAVANSSEFLSAEVENVVLMVAQAPAFLSFQEPIESGFASSGKQIAATVALTPGEASYADATQEALVHSPDLIILVADPADSVTVMQEATAAGYSGAWFFTQDQTTADYINLATPELVEGSYGLREIGAPESGEALAAFTKEYELIRHEQPPLFAANTYDAATVLALAMLRADIHDWEVTSATVNANLPLVANPGEGKVTVTNYGAGKEVLSNGGEINYQGVTGPIDFDEFGNITQPYGIFRVQNGAWVQISTVNNDTLQTMLEAQ